MGGAPIEAHHAGADTRWEYTYHGRLAAYGTWQESRDGKPVRVGGFNIDQIEAVIGTKALHDFKYGQELRWTDLGA